MTFLGYQREPHVFEPPLGGEPWNEAFPEWLNDFMKVARKDFETESAKKSWYGTRYTAADDVFHQAAALERAWKSARQAGTPEAAGMFEVRLLSTVLVAHGNLVPSMVNEANNVPGTRPARSFLNDLRTAAKVLAAYTGADAEEIQNQAHEQRALTGYLSQVRDARKGRS